MKDCRTSREDRQAKTVIGDGSVWCLGACGDMLMEKTIL